MSRRRRSKRKSVFTKEQQGVGVRVRRLALGLTNIMISFFSLKTAEHKNAKTQKHKKAKTQEHKNTETQKHRGALGEEWLPKRE